jgi:hypothetical protein
MNELRELAGIVNKNKLRAVANVTGKTFLPGPMALKLYDLVAENKVNTDEEAIAILFPGKTKNAMQPYQRIKNALWDYLIQMLLVIDPALPQYNARQRSFFECHKKWAAIKILIGRNAHRSTIEVASEVYKLARKYDFTEVALDVARSMRLYYGSIEGDLKKHTLYSKEVTMLEEMFRYENLAEYHYTDQIIGFVNSKAAQKNINFEASKLFEQIEQGLHLYDSYRLHFMGRLLETLIYSSINDHKNTIVVCDKAIRFFESKNYTANVPLQAFLYQEMVCYLQLRDYDRGRAAATRGLSLLQEGSFNWFKYQELLIFLTFHTGKYQDSFEIYKVTVKHRRFATLPAGIQQIWKIFEAYLHYLLASNLILPEEDEKAMISRFRMARFLNETPLYNKDRRGLNIPILIFQILFLILTKRYDETIDRIEAIEKYTTRYLKKDDNFRSNCFVKMLLQIAVAGFHQAAVARHADKYIKMLDKVPLDFANQAHDIEIVPYEVLWKLAIDSLSNTVYKPRAAKKTSK